MFVRFDRLVQVLTFVTFQNLMLTTQLENYIENSRAYVEVP